MTTEENGNNWKSWTMDENGAHWERCLFMIELMAKSKTMDENEISWKGSTKSSILNDLSPP